MGKVQQAGLKPANLEGPEVEYAQECSSDDAMVVDEDLSKPACGLVWLIAWPAPVGGPSQEGTTVQQGVQLQEDRLVQEGLPNRLVPLCMPELRGQKRV